MEHGYELVIHKSEETNERTAYSRFGAAAARWYAATCQHIKNDVTLQVLRFPSVAPTPVQVTTYVNRRCRCTTGPTHASRLHLSWHFHPFGSKAVYCALTGMFCTAVLTSSFRRFATGYQPLWAAVAQSVQRLATGWSVRGSNPGGSETFRTRPHPPCDPPSLL